MLRHVVELGLDTKGTETLVDGELARMPLPMTSGRHMKPLMRDYRLYLNAIREIVVSGTGLVDTYAGIVLPQVLGVFTTMMLISFFTTIPDDLIDAAKIDGCGYFSILWHVIIVNSVTAISAAVLYAFLSHWRSYLWPLLVTNKTEMRTLAVGLKYLISEASSAYQLMMAAALMSIAPLIIVYILCEKNFVRSMTMTGLKG